MIDVINVLPTTARNVPSLNGIFVSLENFWMTSCISSEVNLMGVGCVAGWPVRFTRIFLFSPSQIMTAIVGSFNTGLSFPRSICMNVGVGLRSRSVAGSGASRSIGICLD